MRWGRPAPNAGFFARLAAWIARAIVAFVGVSLLFVLLYKWVPVPVTATMVMDPNGFTKE